MRPFGTEPVGGPVERAEERACGDGRVGRAEIAAANAGGDQRAHAAFVPIAFGDDGRAEADGERIDLEVRRRSVDVVDQAEDVGDGKAVEARGQRAARGSCAGERGEQPIERPVLTEEENLVLAPEVGVQVAGRQIRGDCDVAHAGGGEASGAEDAGGGAQDRETARVGAAAGARGAARGTC